MNSGGDCRICVPSGDLWNVIWFTLVSYDMKRQRILEEIREIRTEAGGFPEAESRESEMYQELIRQLYEEKRTGILCAD